MSSWTELLERPEPKQHVVQLYGRDDQLLTRHVGQYLAEGLRRGEGVLLIATPAHTQAIVRSLGEEDARLAASAADGRFLALEAAPTLSRIMVDGEPCRARFDEIVGTRLQELRARPPRGGVRAFGEMVGLLWSTGQTSAAARLEEYWSGLVEPEAVSLFCAYPIDVPGGECAADTLKSVALGHTHVYAAPRTLFASPSSRSRPH